MKYQVIPRNLIFLFNQDKVLLQKGAPNKIHWAGLYNGLGGHIEAKENIYSSATRELMEESGIKLETKDIKLKGIMHVFTYFQEHVFMFIFSADINSENFIDSEEGTLEWVNINDLGKIKNIAEDIQIIVKEIRKFPEGKIMTGVSEYNKDRKLTKFEYEIVSA